MSDVAYRERGTELAAAVGESDELVNRVLWAVIACGGSETYAWRQLQDEGVKRSDGSTISRSTIGNWKRKVFRNRYTEMRRMKLDQVDEVIVQSGQDLAMRIAEAEGRAIKQTMAGLSTADGVEASQILRNLSQSKQVQINGGVALRGSAVGREQQQTMTDLIKELGGLGIAVVRQQMRGLEGPQVEGGEDNGEEVVEAEAAWEEALVVED